MSENTGAPAPGGGFNARAIISIVETVAFAFATVMAILHGGHITNPYAGVPALIGFVAHGVNHPAGGSPI